jgi:hypothetical protein
MTDNATDVKLNDLVVSKAGWIYFISGREQKENSVPPVRPVPWSRGRGDRSVAEADEAPRPRDSCQRQITCLLLNSLLSPFVPAPTSKPVGSMAKLRGVASVNSRCTRENIPLVGFITYTTTEL